MYLNEQYLLYRIAYTLVKNEGYNIFYINNETEEIWLEKYSNKSSKVIRLLHKGFDWKNHLGHDIKNVYQKVNQIKRFFVGKKIVIHNIYISTHVPVDEWEIFKKPIKMNKRKDTIMYVYYFAEDTPFHEEMSRFKDNTGISTIDFSNEMIESKKAEYVKYYKYQLKNIFQKERKKFSDVLSFGKPFFTYALMIINVILFFLLEVNGGSTNIETLIRFGAKYNPGIVNGEWWRILSSMFLHIWVFHLFMNMFALYYLGIVVERIYGSWRFLFIYFMAGVVGGLASFAFSFSLSAGASGAIFGLFGALLFFGVIHKKIFLQTMGSGLITVIVINVALGLIIPQIDISAHLGGLIAGFLASAIFQLPRNKNLSIQFISLVLYILLTIGLSIAGIQNSTKSSLPVMNDQSSQEELYINQNRNFTKKYVI